jgi:uncharacterized protein DUF5906
MNKIVRLVDQASQQKDKPEAKGDLTPDDFVAYMPTHSYIYTPTRAMWPAASVNARVNPIEGMKASDWLDRNRPVEQMSWAPGEPMLIQNKIINDGGWVDTPNTTVFNLYREPAVVPKSGDPSPWLDHTYKIYPDEASHIIHWMAHRVQRPWEKINHAIVLLGAQGIGKDTTLEPVKTAVGPWNFAEVSPGQVLGRFNGFLKSTVLRVSEARDTGGYDRFALYNHLKTMTASPPTTLLVDQKHLAEYSIPNVISVIITANDKINGIYLPADDRRHFVTWSHLTKDDFTEEYWSRLYGWYESGGNEIVAHYLMNLDISGFNAKAPPPKTPAFWDIVDAGRSPEDAEFMDVLDVLGNPPAVTVSMIRNAASNHSFREFLDDRNNRKLIPHRFGDCGYDKVRNPNDNEGRWKLGGRRQAVYAKRELSERDKFTAVTEEGGAELMGREVREARDPLIA